MRSMVISNWLSTMIAMGGDEHKTIIASGQGSAPADPLFVTT
jgi:hypothetical protein